MATETPTTGRLALIADQIRDPTATGVERRRRSLQIALALVWLLDGALQLQPFMFGKHFVTAFLIGTQSGNPQMIKSPMGWVAHLVLHNPAFFNSVFALIQLSLAIGLLWRPTVKRALAASILWSLAVWWFGEGTGGVFSGGTPVMGYPGAVLLYALIALFVWPTERASTSVATSGALGDGAAKALWLILWASFVRFLLLAANRSPQGLNQALAAMAPGEPGWEKSIDNHLARALANHGTQVSLGLALLCAIVAVVVFVPALLKPGLIVAAVVALCWWVAQDFGAVFTSQGTDPNTGPLLVLLAATFWPPPPHGRAEINNRGVNVGGQKDWSSSSRSS